MIKSIERIGWYNTAQCSTGYNLYPVTKQERELYNCNYRISSFARAGTALDWTSVVWIDKGKVSFINDTSILKGERITYQRAINILKLIWE